jgi:hypothetical protein
MPRALLNTAMCSSTMTRSPTLTSSGRLYLMVPHMKR